jgi:pimeloyl-ACP methyl ester carboxylesterase
MGEVLLRRAMGSERRWEDVEKEWPSGWPTISVDRMAQDGIELTEYLRKHLGREKIIIVAHSFGSILGLRMAKAKPDLFSAYVGTGQVADNTRSSSVAYDVLVKKAKAVDDQRAIEELARVGRPRLTNPAMDAACSTSGRMPLRAQMSFCMGPSASRS